MTVGPFFVNDILSDTVEIAVTRDGVPADLDGYTGVTVVLYDGSGVATSPAPSGTISDSTVIVTFPTTTCFLTAGVYTLVPTLTAPTAQEVVDPVLISVLATPELEEWVTPAYVYQVSKVTVDESDVTAAVAVIELLTNRDLSDASVYAARDLRNLKYAIAYQSAYMASNPAILNDVQATSKAVGDVSISYDTTTTGSQWLAPLARAALRKVSWKKSRTLEVGRLQDRVVDPLSESDDEFFQWTPTPQ